jgi:hypothetical protein
MTLFAMLAAAAAAAAVPQPQELRTFEDWTVGCDNGRICHAVALVPEDWPEDALTMRVLRGPQPEAVPQIALELGDDSGVAALSADGAKLDVRLAMDGDGMLAVTPSDGAVMLRALRSAAQLEALGTDGNPLRRVSLKGASAALLYMDDRQGRVGTVTALVRPGDKPASAVPPAPPVPRVRAVPAGGEPLVLTDAELRALRKRLKCTLDEVGGPEEHEVTALGGGRSLVLLACGSGAYNVSLVPVVAERKGGKLVTALAEFDAPEEWWREEGKPILVNATWDAERARLVTFSRARGLGDCGSTSDYVWDGTRFRLVEQAQMDECRGSRDYIVTWRVEVVAP